MRGQEAIIAARMSGAKPSRITLLTQNYPVGVPAWSIPADWVFVEPGDSIAGLDLRFVVGCLVFIDGKDSARVRSLLAAAKAAGANRVIGSVAGPSGDGFEVTELVDTDGAMTWPN